MGVFSLTIKCALLVMISIEIRCDDDDYNVLHRDGSYEFGYKTPDSYHYADANRKNVVRGEFGARNPATGGIDSTVYTAGPRGYRPRGKNIARKYDLNQNGPRPVGSPDDPHYDPFEDPSYSFSFKTRTYSRQENANRIGDVNGKYTYLDDIGERHNVEFIAGKKTGFHVKTPFPDSNPRALGPLYYNGRGKPIPRGRTSIQRGLDGSYRFVSAGPDQRRTEISDSSGHVRGSYTYLDDKGVQHSVHYIAGPGIGYRVLKNVKGPHLPTVFPFGYPDILPPNFYDFYKDDVFDSHNKPFHPTTRGGDNKQTSGSGIPDVIGGDSDSESNGKPGFSRPNYDEDSGDSNDFSGDLFGGNPASSTAKPGISKPANDGTYQSSYDNDDGQYRPNINDGQYRPNGNDGQYRPKPSLSSNSGGGGGVGGGDGSGVGVGVGVGNDGQYRPKPSISSNGGGTDGQYRPIPSINRNGGGNDGQYRPKPSIGGGDDDYGTFDDSGNTVNEGRPIIQITNQNTNCERCKGTIVTNVGDKLFTVPPGVSVRAHVQSIDLLPLASQVPSPTEQFNAEMNLKTEQLNSASTHVDDRFKINDNAEISTTSTTESVGTTVAETVSTTTTEKTVTTPPVTTTTTTKTTTTISTQSNSDNDDDIDIF